MKRLAALLTAAFFAPTLLNANTDAAATAQRAADMLQDAAAALAEADGARDRVEALTETVRAYEEGLLALREGVRQAALRERAILFIFDAERERLSRLLGVLQSIQAAPGPSLLLHPEGPLGTARAGMIVADVTPAVASEAEVLRAQLEELTQLRAVQEAALTQLSDGLSGVQTARATLSQAIAERRTLPSPQALNTDAMQTILQNALSLDDFAEALRIQRPTATATLPNFADAQGALQPPVLGTVLRQFNEPDAAGVARPGLVLATRPNALLTAPWPSIVRYAGQLLDYGNVIILEPEADYLMIIAGSETVFVEAGQLLQANAPIGLMPGPDTTGEELIMPESPGGGAILSETLYLELRQAGRTVDPTEWFTIDE